MSDAPRRHRPLYRLYHLSPTGGIVRADILEAADDEDAIRLVLTMAVDHPCELWDRARFVAKAEPPANALSREPVLTRRAAALDPTAAEIAEDGKPLGR